MNLRAIFIEISKGKMTRSLLVYLYLFRRFVGKAEKKDFGEPGFFKKRPVHPAW